MYIICRVVAKRMLLRITFMSYDLNILPVEVQEFLMVMISGHFRCPYYAEYISCRVEAVLQLFTIDTSPQFSKLHLSRHI